MKTNRLMWLVLSVICILTASCKDDTNTAGSSSLQDKDGIRVKADTFAMQSALGLSQAMTLTPDSFLLGECDTHFGTIKADILTQLACPEGFAYPQNSNATVDSVCLFLYYNSWYGDGYAPLGITVYQIDRNALNYDDRYPSDTTLSAFCSLADSTHICAQSRIIIPAEPTDTVYSSSSSTYIPYIRIKLTDEFAKRFFQIQQFDSQDDFVQQFKGLYITSDFGGSTVLYVSDISMAVYYHFDYAVEGTDTIMTDIKAFYANSEVKQVNRYIYPDRQNVIRQLDMVQDTDFIVSPANIYTHLSLHIDTILRRMETQLGSEQDYRIYVNRATLTLDVLYNADNTSTRPRDTWDKPATYMMLIKEDYMETFFAKNHLPSDTAAIIGTLTATTDSLANVSYSYSYDLSKLLTNQLRSDAPAEVVNFMLVPVAVSTTTSSSTTTITSVKPLQTISATCIRSADNPIDPMDIEMVYSAFNTQRY